MRLRRPAVAATALGLAGALLPASGAAAEPDRHREFHEDFYYEGPGGSSLYCTVIAHLDWTFGQEGTRDDTLSATTEVRRPSGPNAGDCDYTQSSVTLRWLENYYNRAEAKTYTSQGDVAAGVSVGTSPYSDTTGFGAEGVSSEHHVLVGLDCRANCEWSHTLTFNSK